jgi:hypothetical protein
MRPRERRETSEQDLFRSRLDQIIDMKHALVKLARAIWRSSAFHLSLSDVICIAAKAMVVKEARMYRPFAV